MKKLSLCVALLALVALAIPSFAATLPAVGPQSTVSDCPAVTMTPGLEASLDALVLEAAGPQITKAASCPDRARVYYYSDASHTNQVGTCWHACCQLWSCTGQLSDYYTVFTFPCDFN